MKYSQEMILQSPSGYCMPFEEHDKEVEMTLGYGKQLHPKTGVEFFHHGVDFSAPHYLLSAVASGIVSGIGNDTQRGVYLVIRYGDYEVSYGHLSSILVGYGEAVDAGQTVGVSDDVLHLETKYKGEEFDPIEFLTMIYGNIKSMERRGETFGKTDFREMAGGFRTKYDKDAFLPRLPEGFGQRRVPSPAKDRAEPEEHADDGIGPQLLLRDDPEHGESDGPGAQEHPAGREGPEPPAGGFPGLPRAPARDLPLRLG